MVVSYIIVALLLALFIHNKQMGALMTVIWYPTLYCIPFKFVSNQMTALYFMEYVVVAYVIYNYKKLGRQGENGSFPFKVGFIATLLSILVSSMFNKVNTMYVVNYLVTMMFPFFVWKLYQPSEKINKFIITNVVIYVVVLSLIGYNEAVTLYNPLNVWKKGLGVETGIQGEEYIRFGVYRAQSLTIWCSAYGVACGLGMVFLLNYWLKRYDKLRFAHYAVILMCIASVFICGTRSVILMTAIAVLSIMDKYKFKFQNVLLVVIVLIIADIYLPEYFNKVIDSFVNSDEAGGSSVEMRESQMYAAMYFYSQSPLIGQGVGYMAEALLKSAELLGGESILYSLLIERGALGIVSFILLFVEGALVLFRSGQKWLIFLLAAFFIAKIMSLLPGFNETYIFLYLIPLILIARKQDAEKETSVSLDEEGTEPSSKTMRA